MCPCPDSVLKRAPFFFRGSHSVEQNLEERAAPVLQKRQTANETEQLKLPLRSRRAEVAQSSLNPMLLFVLCLQNPNKYPETIFIQHLCHRMSWGPKECIQEGIRQINGG